MKRYRSVEMPRCHFDRSPRFCFRRKHGGEVEKSIKKQNPSRAMSRDFSTRLRLARNDILKSFQHNKALSDCFARLRLVRSDFFMRLLGRCRVCPKKRL
jgi:hypothetical protein